MFILSPRTHIKLFLSRYLWSKICLEVVKAVLGLFLRREFMLFLRYLAVINGNYILSGWVRTFKSCLARKYALTSSVILIPSPPSDFGHISYHNQSLNSAWAFKISISLLLCQKKFIFTLSISLYINLEFWTNTWKIEGYMWVSIGYNSTILAYNFPPILFLISSKSTLVLRQSIFEQSKYIPMFLGVFLENIRYLLSYYFVDSSRGLTF